MEFIISRTKRSFEFNMAASHWHPVYELFYLVSGHCRIIINHTLHYIEPGDLILIAPGEIHRTTHYSSLVNERITVSFDKEYLGLLKEQCGDELTNYLLRYSKVSIPAGRQAFAEELINKMEYEAVGKDGYSPFMTHIYLYEFLVFLSRCQEAKQEPVKISVAEDRKSVV